MRHLRWGSPTVANKSTTGHDRFVAGLVALAIAVAILLATILVPVLSEPRETRPCETDYSCGGK